MIVVDSHKLGVIFVNDHEHKRQDLDMLGRELEQDRHNNKKHKLKEVFTNDYIYC